MTAVVVTSRFGRRSCEGWNAGIGYFTGRRSFFWAYSWANWCCWLRLGVVQSRAVVGSGFHVAFSLLFFLGTPALANILVLHKNGPFVARWYFAGAICTIFAFYLVLLQYTTFRNHFMALTVRMAHTVRTVRNEGAPCKRIRHPPNAVPRISVAGPLNSLAEFRERRVMRLSCVRKRGGQSSQGLAVVRPRNKLFPCDHRRGQT